jgi:hypothetical protein
MNGVQTLNLTFDEDSVLAQKKSKFGQNNNFWLNVRL